MSGTISSIGGYSAQAVSGASMRKPPAQRMAQLFDQIDTSNTGSITKAQFEQAFQTMNPPAALKSMGADAIFNQLDPNGTGSVSKQDFVSGMKDVLSQARSAHHHRNSTASSTSSTLASSLQSLQSTIDTSA